MLQNSLLEVNKQHPEEEEFFSPHLEEVLGSLFLRHTEIFLLVPTHSHGHCSLSIYVFFASGVL